MAAVVDEMGAGAALTTANEQAGKTLDAILALAKRASAPDGTVMLFPNGIELIYLKLEAGITQTTKVAVEIKIAGPKPAPGTEVVVSADGARASDPTP